MLRPDEQNFIVHRRAIWGILVALRNDKISLTEAEQRIRKELYGRKVAT